jgi:alcohol dehydrogenase YqhD (iron-dependent ADH family)
MWSAALAWNGLVLAGIGKCGYPNHLIGHAMSALYGTQHGASISVSFSGWMPYFIAESAANARKMSQFGKAVFAINGQDTTKSAEATVAAFRNWCKKIGAPTTLKEIGIDDTGLHRVAENASLGAEGWGIPQYTKERISHILSRCE